MTKSLFVPRPRVCFRNGVSSSTRGKVGPSRRHIWCHSHSVQVMAVILCEHHTLLSLYYNEWVNEYLGFPWQFSFHRLLDNHRHLSSEAGTIGQTVADVPSGHSLTPRYPCNRPRRAVGSWDVEDPTFSRQSTHRRWWGCQPYAPTALYPQEDSWYSFLLEGESTPGKD
jgi:hypothetical protein